MDILGLGADLTSSLVNQVKQELLNAGIDAGDVLPEYAVVLVGNRHPIEKIVEELSSFIEEGQARSLATWLMNRIQELQNAKNAFAGPLSTNPHSSAQLLPPPATMPLTISKDEEMSETLPPLTTPQLQSRSFSSAINDLAKNSLRSDPQPPRRDREMTDRERREQRFGESSNRERREHRFGESSNRERREQRLGESSDLGRREQRLGEERSSLDRRASSRDRHYASSRGDRHDTHDSHHNRHRSRSREGRRRREERERNQPPENFTIRIRTDDGPDDEPQRYRRDGARDRPNRDRSNILRESRNVTDARQLLNTLRQGRGGGGGGGDGETTNNEQPVNHGSHAIFPQVAPRKKCAYWPNCKSGDVCPFVHPTEPCKYFPNCTHAAECLFLHPSLPCRFQDRCMNETCNYQHSAPMAGPSIAAATVAPITITCRFHPNCANINCPYVHPIAVPCKFGEGCQRPSCPFVHPQGRSTAKSMINMPCRYGKACSRLDCPYIHNTTSESSKEDVAMPPVDAAEQQQQPSQQQSFIINESMNSVPIL